MDQIRVSVIIPVYNASLYIRQCLDSVTGQSLKDIEIICVDDGSTDDSLDILREYQNADPRLKVMSQKNSFAGAARNNGMSQAEGKYLVFWDSDDFFNETALEKLYAKCEEDQAEAAVCGAQRFSDDTQKAVHFEGYLRRAMLPEKTPFAFEDIKDYIFNFTCEAAWNKMFLRSFIEEQGLRFHETRNGNDLYFTMMALTQAKKITVVPEDLVFYRRQQKNSLVSSIDKSALSVFKEWILLKQDLEKKNIDCERSFHNKIISVIRYNLQLSTSAKAFNEKYEWLQTEGIEAFGLEKKEEGYFFNKEKEEFLSVLLEENADDCLIWLNNRNFWNIFSQQTML